MRVVEKVGRVLRSSIFQVSKSLESSHKGSSFSKEARPTLPSNIFRRKTLARKQVRMILLASSHLILWIRSLKARAKRSRQNKLNSKNQKVMKTQLLP